MVYTILTVVVSPVQNGVAAHQRRSGLLAKEMAVPGVPRLDVHGSRHHRSDHRTRARTAHRPRLVRRRRRRRHARRNGGHHGREPNPGRGPVLYHCCRSQQPTRRLSGYRVWHPLEQNSVALMVCCALRCII